MVNRCRMLFIAPLKIATEDTESTEKEKKLSAFHGLCGRILINGAVPLGRLHSFTVLWILDGTLSPCNQ